MATDEAKPNLNHAWLTWGPQDRVVDLKFVQSPDGRQQDQHSLAQVERMIGWESSGGKLLAGAPIAKEISCLNVNHVCRWGSQVCWIQCTTLSYVQVMQFS